MPWLIPVGMAVAGAVGGAVGKKSSSGVNLGPESDFQGQLGGAKGAAGGDVQNNYNAMQGMVNAGPGQTDVANAYGAQGDLASMLQQYSQGGYQPTAADISSGNQLSTALFAPQQTQLNQLFTQQGIDASRLSASMGREANDPILQAKLRTGYMNQQGQLNSQVNAYGTQLAMDAPMKRLGFAQDRTQLLSGLASNAMQNRSAILGLGNQLLQGQQQWQYQTSDKYNNQGGGLGGALSGAIGGFGMGMSTMGQGAKTGFFGGGDNGSASGYGHNVDLGWANRPTSL